LLDFQYQCCNGRCLQIIEMTFTEFQSHKIQPVLSGLLVALWHNAQDDWQKAHELAQDVETTDGAWVHAYLHRKEGDSSNANYWYRQAGKKIPTQTLKQEWEEIVTELLKKESVRKP
jgi:hypothetical protein